ncbi:MAG: DUF433 domain-containing protein [Phycisphaerales bacterium]
MNWQEYIHRDSNVLGGKPIVRRTRISITLILEHLAGGWTHDQILENYPTLKPEHITAVLGYAADAVNDDDVIFLERLGS